MKRKVRGYSILETVVVAGVLGVGMAASAPSLINATRTYKLNAAATKVAQTFQGARFESIRQNTSNYVSFDINSNSIVISTTNVTASNTVVTTVTATFPLSDGIAITSLPSTIAAPSIVQTAWSYRNTFKDDAYKALANSRVATSFPADDKTTGSSNSGTGNNNSSTPTRFKCGFTSKGLPASSTGGVSDPGSVNWIYLRNVNNEYMAITVSSAGSTQVWRYKNNNWTALNT